jgi:hypothetical protein
MAFDRISEEIAHFIGMFHLEIEGHRLRLEYDAFSVQQRDHDRNFDPPPELKVSAPFAMKGFDPALVYLRSVPETPLPSLLPLEIVPGPINVAALPPSLPELDVEFPTPAFGWQFSGVWIPLPNSILIAIRQTAELSDNDLLLFNGTASFTDPAKLAADFQELVATAEALEAPVLYSPSVLPRVDAMTELASRIAAFAPDDSRAEIQLLMRGEGLQGVFLNGSQIPAEPTDAATPMDGNGGPSGSLDGGGARASQNTDRDDPEDTGLPDFKDVLPTYLLPKWVPSDEEEEPEKDPFALPRDPTIAPGIDVLDIDPGHKVVTGGNVVINEVAIYQAWIDAPVIAVAGDAIRLDSISQVNVRQEASPIDLPGVEVLPSTSLNGLRIKTESAPEPASGPTNQLPATATVVRVEGDLVAVNWIQQHVFATDFDRAEIVITAAATYISTGENVITNAAWLREFGFHYDLVLVGGDMITLNQISQINVLLDVDAISGLPETGVAAKAGDNLQYNLAEIKQTGHDEIVVMKASFQKALEDMAQGKREVSQEVLRDARFEGKTALKVLQVEGDLIKVNIIEQKNYLGDADQVQLMLDAFLAAGDGLELITGSNAQFNSARIHDHGIDSEVMVAGTAYSDALIYQAQLLDPEAPPAGVTLAPLANEAVVFLADDMIGAQHDTEPSQHTGVDHHANADALYAIIT